MRRSEWRKHLAMLLSVTLCVSLAGCSGQGAKEETVTQKKTITTDEEDISDVDVSTQNVDENEADYSESDFNDSDEGIMSAQDDAEETEMSEYGAISESIAAVERKLSRELLREDENVFYSPYSLFRVMMLLDNAETDKAKEEIERVFEVSDLDKINEQFSVYDAGVSENNEEVILKTADSLWLSEKLGLEDGAEEYKKLLQNYYDSDIFNVDFTKDKAKESINAWVSEKTEGMINPFLEELSVETDFALVDAVYFDGKWQLPFKEELTKKGSFYGSLGETQTDMMTMHSESFKVVEQGEIIGVELPYQGKRFVMDVYTSGNGDILQQFHELSDAERDKFFSCFDEVEEKQNLDRLVLPKFSFEHKVDGLDDCLKELGLKSMYESGYLSDLNESLYVDSVLQKAKVEVDEQGTKAAAASGVMMQEMAMAPSGLELIIDRPFVFVIRDQVSDLILFVGSVQNLQ